MRRIDMKKALIRIGTLLLALVMTVSVVGCGGSNDDASSGSGNNKKPPSKAEAVVNDNVATKDYEGTEITYATWRNPAQYEDGPVVAEFEKKYGIKVNVDLMTESEYTNKVLAKIAIGNAPDVYFSTYTFPYCIDALQPIDAAKLNLEESI
jgi:ABC-type glycerol-3-phosphate transport system substrate-binding protein